MRSWNDVSMFMRGICDVPHKNPFPNEILMPYNVSLTLHPYHLVCLYPHFTHSDVYPKYYSSQLKIGIGEVLTLSPTKTDHVLMTVPLHKYSWYDC